MPDDEKGIAHNTEEELGDVLYRIEDFTKEALEMVRPLPGHINDLLTRVSNLEIGKAAHVIPETIGDESTQAGKTLAAGGDVVGSGASTAIAVPTDVLEDVGSVAGNTTKSTRGIFRTKIRRSK